MAILKNLMGKYKSPFILNKALCDANTTYLKIHAHEVNVISRGTKALNNPEC